MSASFASDDGADRISISVPGLGDAIVRLDSCTGDANDVMIPTPGLSAGNCCL